MVKNALSSLMSGPVARGSAVSMILSLLSLGLVTLQAILTARALGPSGYGTIAYVMSLATILAMIAMVGTQQLAAREVARSVTQKDDKRLKGFITSVRRMVLLTSAIGAVLWLGGTLLFADSPVPIIFVAFIFPALALALQTQGILRGFGAIALSLIPIGILRPAMMVAVLGGALASSSQLSPTAYLVFLFAATCLAALFALRAAGQRLPDLQDGAPFPPQEIVSMAFPFLVVAVVALLQSEISTIMLTWWAGAEETGLFQPIARVAPVLMLASQSVAVRFGPRITEFWTTGEYERLQAVTRKVTLATTGFTLLSAVALVVMGEWILGLFGPAFTVTTSALIWIGAAQVFNAACGPTGLLLTMSDKAGFAIWPQILGLAVNIALGAVLIPSQGAMGAAMAMSCGIVVWNLAIWFAVRRQLGFDPSIIGALRNAN